MFNDVHVDEDDPLVVKALINTGARLNGAPLLKFKCGNCGYQAPPGLTVDALGVHFELWHGSTGIDLIPLNSVPTERQVDAMDNQVITDTLKALADATAEARQATRDLHSAKKEAAHFFKEEKSRVVKMVEEAIEPLAKEAEGEMKKQVADVLSRIEADWREKLGLST